MTGDQSSTIDRDKFPVLLQLLLKHKGMIEYKLSAIRSTASNSVVSHHAEENSQLEMTSLMSVEDRKPRCWLHAEESSHPIWKCPDLINMSSKERIESVRIHRACFRCLGVGHVARLCRKGFKCRIDNCNQPHHDLLHEACTSVSSYTSYHGTHNKVKGTEDVLLQIQKIRCKQRNGRYDNINVLWDSGSTVSFITFKKARNLKLRSLEKVNMHITKVGGCSEIVVSERFQLTVIDNINNNIQLNVFGIDKISNDIVGINIEQIKNIFIGILWTNFNRPDKGEIDCLVGLDLANYHPVKKSAVGNLLLLENQFGYVVGGSHTKLKERSEKIINEARVLHVNIRIDDFYKIEQLGVEVPPKCGACRWGKCQPGGGP